MIVGLLCTTYNRNTYLTRILRSYIEMEQDDNTHSYLVVFNSGVPTSFPEIELSTNKEIVLINRTTSLKTGKGYTSVGEKYNDLIELCPKCDIVTSYDADDLFLPNHIIDGVKGMKKAYEMGKVAYKPKYSYCITASDFVRNENTYETSIFVDYSWIKEKGYGAQSVIYHNQWLLPLISEDKIFVDPEGNSSLIYDWSQQIPTYKMSGRPESVENFHLSQRLNQDTGNGVTSPMTKKQFESYYKKRLEDFERKNTEILS